MPEAQSDDPIVGTSYATAILISSFLLVVTLAWALYDEFFGLRPWRSYQREFSSVYDKYLEKQIPLQGAALKAVQESPKYRQLKDAHDAAMKAASPHVQQIDADTAFVNLQLGDITDAFTTARGKIQALTYQVELAPKGSSSRKSREADVEDAKKETYDVELHTRDGKIEPKKLHYAELDVLFTGLKGQKAKLTTDRVAALKEANDIQAQMEEFKKEQMTGLTPDQLRSLQRAAQEIEIEIRQVNVSSTNVTLNNMGSGGLVDRCQSCHLGMDTKLVPPAMTLTKADLGLAKSHDAPFTSHPAQELLKIHTLDRFGCSPCHGGNGRAV